MKKKLILSLFTVLVVFVIAVVVYFAYFKVDAKELINKNVSEIDKVCFTAHNGLSQVKLISGTREDPYLLNGKSENCKPFALIIFRTNQAGVQAPTFVASINDKSYNGIMEANPYDNTFVVDLEQEVNDDATINVKITINDNTYNYDLINTSADWLVKAEQAKDIAIEYFLDKIKDCSSYKGVDAELFVRILSDNSGNFDKFFYHITLNKTDGEVCSIVIDTNTGDIIK